MNAKDPNDQIVRFFNGRELTFCVERFGDNFEEWVARCNEIPAINTSGFGFDEREIRDQVKDAILTAAGVDGDNADRVLREFSLTGTLTARA